MKTFNIKLFVFGIGFLFLVSCSSLKNISFYDDTDSYVNAKKERQQRMEMLAKQRKQQEERQKYIQDSIAKEQEKLNNNPYYKEPNYSKDDYYDYEYASRIKRFYNPVSGLGYYDNWYTNCGFYGCPNYGSSIYMGWGNFSPYMSIGYNYMWGSPYYSYGLGWGYPYSYWNNWGYSPWYGYSPYYGGYYPYGYSPYYGYNPYYYNSQDVNSMTYAPRSSHTGFNARRTTNNINSTNNNISRSSQLISPQIDLPKFDETARPKPITKLEPSQINAINAPLIHQINTNPNIQSSVIPRNVINNSNAGNINSVSPNIGISNLPKGSGNNNPGRPNNGNSKPIVVPVGPKESSPNIQTSPTQKGWGGGNNSGGFSSPRGGNGGGSISRPK
ncbi:MAG: hypothetical protein KatS3mg027_0074 [Bacteroidia bacterium]|nr:MAG: hypothetical protein KatS3mg027_0074 [Bacteroidia bacterium]